MTAHASQIASASTGPSPSGTPLDGLDLADLVWWSDAVLVALADASAVVVDANPTFQQLLGRDPRGERLASFGVEAQAVSFEAWLVSAGPGWSRRVWGMLADANKVPRDVRLAVRRLPDHRLILVGEVPAAEDLATALRDVNETIIGEQRRLSREGERLDHLAQQDALSGLGNRRAFDARLAREIAHAAAGGAFSLVLLDIDHFKAVNDRFGHPAGDDVIRWLGEHLRAAARRADFVARYGGEEFVAILASADTTGATRWAERLRRTLREKPSPAVDSEITVSIGVAEWLTGNAAADIVERADRALYAAKRSGRDRVVTDGLTLPQIAEEPSDLPDPLWLASSIGLAIIRVDRVEQANGALTRLIGRPAQELPVGALVHPDQAPAFIEFIRAAGHAWQKATYGFDPDARGILLDRVTWARRRGEVVQLLVEPASAERDAVEETLLALVDDLIEIQRELERRTKALERALVEKAAATGRAADLERLLPICAWCGRIRRESGEGQAWMGVPEYLEAEGIAVTHGICEDCHAAMTEPEASAEAAAR